MILPEVMFLAAHTTRSQAYAQAMCKAGIEPAMTLLYGEEKGIPHIKETETQIPGLFSPNFSEPLKETVKRFKEVQHVTNGDVNGQEVYDIVASQKPRLLIYSGYGGQIVKKRILSLGTLFLHIHSGWLPDYRGSTTVYYSILKEQSCGASAILLSPEIDKGVILKRKKYPVPSREVNIDYVYDNTIRADLLIEVLQMWKMKGSFVDFIVQKPDEGEIYYVIHPLLKHLSILSLN